MVAFITASERPHFTGDRQAVIDDLAVSEDFEGRGIAKALLRVVEVWAQARHLSYISVETGATNDRALSLYRNAGFADEDVRLTKVVG